MPRTADDEFGRAPLPLLCTEADLPDIAVDNSLDLVEYISSLAHQWAGSYRYTPAIVLEANRIAMKGIYACAGVYRDCYRTAGELIPPSWREVPQLTQDMCDVANGMVGDPILAAAYLMWRVNWIHPFYDGNGRVARELAYLALLVGFGIDEFAGSLSIPELLDRNHRDEYYEALRDADCLWTRDRMPKVEKLESLIAILIVEQSESN